MNRTLKCLLSVFIVYHLYAVVLSPNSGNYLGSKSSPLFGFYVNLFGLMTSWSFFAPDPGPPPLFVEWELLNKEGKSLGLGRWPQLPDPYFLRERQNRRIQAARTMVESDVRAEKMMVPYLCSKNLEASSVRLWSIMYPVPTLIEVANGTRKIGDQVQQSRHWIADGFCGELKG